MRNNLRKFSTLGASFSSRLASLAAWALLAFFAASGSSASVTLYCRVLRSSRPDKTVYDRRWVTRDEGGLGGLDGDRLVYPELASYSYDHDVANFVYWPNSYTRATSPFVYEVVANSALDIRVDNSNTNEIPAIQASLNSLSASERANVNAIAVQYPSAGGANVTVGYNKPGKVLGNAVSTFNADGNLVLAYPDSTGLVPGYQPSATGGYTPVWYDTNVVSSDGYALLLDSLNNTQSSSLSYDSDTGLYSFSLPDYSSQLSAINESIRDIRINPEVIVNPEITVTPPDVTVNPEITVNPTVTVPPPDVTVNPEITVNPPEVNVSVDTDLSDVNSGLTSVNESLDVIAESFYTPAIDSNFSNEVLTEEENALLDVVHGWQTEIPVLGDAMDIGLNVLIGKIPQIDKKYELLNTELWGYHVKCDLNAYKDTILLFRAFFLLCELVWFFWVLWNDIHKALQV